MIFNRIILWYESKKIKKIHRNIRKKRFHLILNFTSNLNFFSKEIFLLGERSNQLSAAKILTDTGLYIEKRVRQRPPLEVRIAIIKNATVIPMTDGFIKNENMYHPDFHLHNDKRIDWKNKSLVLIDEKKIGLPRGLCKKKSLKKPVISLVKEHTFNYYHFIFECLPKLLTISRYIRDGFFCALPGSEFIILVDQDVPSQCLEYISKIINFNYEIKKIKKTQLISCNDLIYCSPFFNALDNTRSDRFLASDFYVDYEAINLVVSSFRVNSEMLPKTNRMLYLKRRKNQVRGLVNQSEVEKIIIDSGFEEVYLDDYSLDEQINLFQNAKCIIGVSGAAFSNIIHMQENSKAIIFTPNLKLTNYYFFQQQADAVGVEIIHLQANSNKEKKTLHDNIHVDIELLRKVIHDFLYASNGIHFSISQ